MSKSKSYDQFKKDWMDLSKIRVEENDRLRKEGEVVITTGAAGAKYFKDQLMDQIYQFGTSVTMGSVKWAGLTSSTTTFSGGSLGPSPGLAWGTYPYSNGWLFSSQGRTINIVEALQMWLKVTNPEMLYIRYYNVPKNTVTKEVKFPSKGSKKKYHLLIPKPFYDSSLYPKGAIVGSQPYYSANLIYHVNWYDLYVDGSPTPLFLTALKNTKIISLENTRKL